MINEETMTFTIPDEQGNPKEYTIMFSFVAPETNKHYLVYTDQSFDENGNLNVLSSIIDEQTDSITPVTTDGEMKLIEDKLIEYQKELSKLG